MSSKNCRQLLHPPNHQHSSNCISSNYESSSDDAALDNTIAIIEYQMDGSSLEYEYVDMIGLDDDDDDFENEGGRLATSSSIASSTIRNYVPYDAERMPV